MALRLNMSKQSVFFCYPVTMFIHVIFVLLLLKSKAEKWTFPIYLLAFQIK